MIARPTTIPGVSQDIFECLTSHLGPLVVWNDIHLSVLHIFILYRENVKYQILLKMSNK